MLSEIIRDKFKMSKFETVKDWQADSKCPLSLETLTSVINRGKEPSIPAFIVMAYLIGVSVKDIAAACKASGDTVFWKVLTDKGA